MSTGSARKEGSEVVVWRPLDAAGKDGDSEDGLREASECWPLEKLSGSGCGCVRHGLPDYAAHGGQGPGCRGAGRSRGSGC